MSRQTIYKTDGRASSIVGGFIVMLAVTLGFVLIVGVFVFAQEDIKVSPVVGLVILIASTCIMATIIATRLWLLAQ